jgi:DNA replication protein DnaC
MAQRLKFIRTLASSSSSSRSKVRPKQKKKPSSSSSSSTDQYEKLFRELEQARNQEFQHKSIIPQESRLWSNTFGFESSYQAAGQQILEGILERFNDPESAVDVVYEQVRASDLDEEQLKMLKKVSKLSDEQIQKAIEREKNMDEEEFDAQLSDLEEYAELDDKARNLAFRRMCSIAIVGTPNSGKSTLLNTLVKNHVWKLHFFCLD